MPAENTAIRMPSQRVWICVVGIFLDHGEGGVFTVNSRPFPCKNSALLTDELSFVVCVCFLHMLPRD